MVKFKLFIKKNKIAFIILLILALILILSKNYIIREAREAALNPSNRIHLINIAKVLTPIKNFILMRNLDDKIALLKSSGACVFCDLSQGNFKGMDLEGVDLRYASLIGADLSNTNLNGVNLSSDTSRYLGQINTIVQGANLSGANLHGVDLRNKDLTGTILTYSKLSGAILDGVDLSNKDLTGVTLTYAILKNVNLDGVDLSNRDLTSINLSGASLSNTNFQDANLTAANLNRVDLSNTNLNGAILTQSNLSGANLDGVDLRNKDLTGVNLIGVDLSNKDLTGTILSYSILGAFSNQNAMIKGLDIINNNLPIVNLSGVDLSNKDLTGISLSGVDLSNTNLNGAILTYANLSGANLDGVDLRNKDLTGVDLSGVDLSNKDLTGTILLNANLSGVILDGVDLRNKDLTGTILTGVDLSNKDLTGTILKDAKKIEISLKEPNKLHWAASNKFNNLNVTRYDLVGDIQYIATKEGFLFEAKNNELRVVLDLNNDSLFNFAYDKVERGFVGIASNNNRVYVAYTSEDINEIKRFGQPLTSLIVDEYSMNFSKVRNIIKIEGFSRMHFAGGLQFDSLGKLYLSVGDGSPNDLYETHPQDLNDYRGKVLRLDISDLQLEPEVIAYGIRNPWGLAIDSKDRMFISACGFSSVESVYFLDNLYSGIPANLGWPIFEGSKRMKDDSLALNDILVPIFETDIRPGCMVGGVYLNDLESFLIADFYGTIRLLKQKENGEWYLLHETSQEKNIFGFGYDKKSKKIFATPNNLELEILFDKFNLSQ